MNYLKKIVNFTYKIKGNLIKSFKKIGLVLLLATLFSPFLLFSQEVDVNKLKAEVQKYINEKNFSFEFVEKVFNIAYYYQHSDPTEGIKYVGDIILIPELLANDELISIIYTKYGNLYAELDKNDIAVDYLTKARNLDYNNNRMGSYYWESVDLGNIFFKLRNYEMAIENYKIAVDGFEKMNDIDFKEIYHARAVANENTGLSFANLLNFDSAYHYFRVSQKYRYLSKNKLGIKLINYNLAKFFFTNKKYDSTYSNLRKSLDMLDFVMELPGINYEYWRYHIKAGFLMSLYFDKLDKKDSSGYYYKQAIKWAEENLTLSPRIVLLNQIAEIYFTENNFKHSLELANMAHDLIFKNEYYNFLPHTNKLLSDLYYVLGDFENAIKFRKEYDRFYDSTFIFSQNKSIELEINSKNLKTKIDKITKQKLEKDQEVKTLYNVGAALIIFIAIIAIFLIIFYKLNTDRKRLNKQLSIKNNELSNINQELRDSQQEVQQANEELLALNEQLRFTNFELEESNNTKNKLFSIIAHDMKNAIGGSISLIDLLNNSYDDLSSDERREYVEMIAQSSNRVYKLLENLLTWSSTLRGKVKANLEHHNLYRVVQNSVDLYQQKAKEKNIEVQNLININLEFYFDASLIDTVIRNILNNSIKYSLPNGKILIDNQNETTYVLIRIKDEGVGMDSQKAAGIFQSEFNKSTEGTNGEKGTGLGLLICYEFVKLHHGEIWFESQINQGTTCFIKLPLIADVP